MPFIILIPVHPAAAIAASVGAEVQFKMNDKWALNADEARYELNVELSMPIDTTLSHLSVCLYTSVRLLNVEYP
mgnify:CR=1 FL=1